MFYQFHIFLSFFSVSRDISLNQYDAKQKQSIVEVCPTDVFEYDEESDSVVIRDASSCIFCRECLYQLEDMRAAPEDKLGVTIEHSAKKFSFTVETTGAISAEKVVLESIQKLKQKVLRVKELASNLGV